MSDRIEAAARAWHIAGWGDDLDPREPMSGADLKEAEAGLAAADAADREQGVHRVKVDIGAVERVARAIFDRHNEGLEWEAIIAEYRDYYRTTARLVLAALEGTL